MNSERKKIVRVIVISCIGILLLSAPFIWRELSETRWSGWQTIEIEDVRDLRVPEDWVFTKREGVIYFTDREFGENDTLDDVTLYMFLLSPNMETWEGEWYDTFSNTFFESVGFVREINRNLVYFPIIFGSPIGQYGDNVYEIDGEEVTKMGIGVSARNVWVGGWRAYLRFIVWDESVSQATVRRIARS